MSILHRILISPKAVSDRSIKSSPAGPVVQVVVTLADAVASVLKQQNIEVPGTITGDALIDTGASVTCIDAGAADELGLPVIDVGYITSASHTNHMCKIYPVKFEISGSSIRGDVPRAMGANLKPQGLIMLIGRDFLKSCTLHYNGLANTFTLSI